uniref:Uncharacterized protein n=1 Tax=Rhizophora mucronata TaxID=61149 RepID=A0A2P2QD34_RHIMU
MYFDQEAETLTLPTTKMMATKWMPYPRLLITIHRGSRMIDILTGPSLW